MMIMITTHYSCSNQNHYNQRIIQITNHQIQVIIKKLLVNLKYENDYYTLSSCNNNSRKSKTLLFLFYIMFLLF